MKIEKIKLNPNNPRIIKDDKFKKLVESIKGFPQMLEKRPIVVDEDMVVLGGNMRLKACEAAGLTDIPVTIAEGWTEEQKREFIVKDNLPFGEWDWETLANEWDVEELGAWGLDVPSFDESLSDADLSDDLKEEYKIEVEVMCEEDQATLYNRLTSEGYKCRVLTL